MDGALGWKETKKYIVVNDGLPPNTKSLEQGRRKLFPDGQIKCGDTQFIVERLDTCKTYHANQNCF